MASAYATITELHKFGIKADALPATVLDADKTAAISAASALADGYLSSRFKLPLGAWGDDLRQNICAIATFELCAGMVGFNPEAGSNLVLLDRKNAAVRWLENVAKGIVTPLVTEGAPAALSGDRVYSDEPRGW